MNSAVETDHGFLEWLVVLHEVGLVLLGPLEQRVHHGAAQVGLRLLLQLGDDLLLGARRSETKQKQTQRRIYVLWWSDLMKLTQTQRRGCVMVL